MNRLVNPRKSGNVQSHLPQIIVNYIKNDHNASVIAGKIGRFKYKKIMENRKKLLESKQRKNTHIVNNNDTGESLSMLPNNIRKILLTKDTVIMPKTHVETVIVPKNYIFFFKLPDKLNELDVRNKSFPLGFIKKFSKNLKKIKCITELWNPSPKNKSKERIKELSKNRIKELDIENHDLTINYMEISKLIFPNLRVLKTDLLYTLKDLPVKLKFIYFKYSRS